MYKELRIALRHLHDPRYLGNLARGGHCDTPNACAATNWERGEALHRALVNAMRRMAPADEASDERSALWFHILWRLYFEGHSRRQIMRDLSLSERHYERRLREGLETLAATWQGPAIVTPNPRSTGRHRSH